MPQLVLPTTAVHASFLEAMQEFADERPRSNNTTVGEQPVWGDRWGSADGFAAYVADLRHAADPGAVRLPDRVPSTALWWVDGVTYLGRLDIRHRLTPGLLEVGGHIGYDVRPSARRQGHATAMLAAALPVAASLGIDPALVTCDDTNVGSRRAIEANGGVLEDQRGVKRRYWVPTSPPA